MDAVVIDQREPLHIQLINFPGVPVTVSLLGAGDAWISAGDSLIVAERKTPSDLVNSIKDERLFSQAARCRALTPWAYLVITGEIRADGNGMAIIGGRASGPEDALALLASENPLTDDALLVEAIARALFVSELFGADAVRQELTE